MDCGNLETVNPTISYTSVAAVTAALIQAVASRLQQQFLILTEVMNVN